MGGCGACEQENPAETRFWNACGTPLATAPTSSQPSCQARRDRAGNIVDGTVSILALAPRKPSPASASRDPAELPVLPPERRQILALGTGSRPGGFSHPAPPASPAPGPWPQSDQNLLRAGRPTAPVLSQLNDLRPELRGERTATPVLLAHDLHDRTSFWGKSLMMLSVKCQRQAKSDPWSAGRFLATVATASEILGGCVVFVSSCEEGAGAASAVGQASAVRGVAGAGVEHRGRGPRGRGFPDDGEQLVARLQDLPPRPGLRFRACAGPAGRPRG